MPPFRVRRIDLGSNKLFSKLDLFLSEQAKTELCAAVSNYLSLYFFRCKGLYSLPLETEASGLAVDLLTVVR